jgi:hypothetical protein
LDHLLLNLKQEFYYTQQGIGSGIGTVATVKVQQLVYPAVQLQVSSAIQGVTCTSKSAQIQFGNQDAYDIALTNWNKAGTFILVAYGEGCGPGHAAGEQDYLVVTSVTGDGSSTITAVIHITDFEGAVGRETIVTVDIGIFNPTNDTGGFTVIPGAGNNTTDGVAQLGVVASIVNNFDLTEQVIAQAALSDLVLGGVLTIGPAVKLSAGANLGFEASGSLLTGATFDWPAISATVDIIDSGNTKIDGFKPDVTPAFQAEGPVTASVTPYVKVALEFTFGLLQG